MDKIKIGVGALTGTLVIAFGTAAQLGLASLASANKSELEALKEDLHKVVASAAAQRDDVAKQKGEIGELQQGVKDAKRDAKAKPAKVVVVLAPTAAPASPTPTAMPDTNPKHGGLLDGIFR